MTKKIKTLRNVKKSQFTSKICFKHVMSDSSLQPKYISPFLSNYIEDSKKNTSQNDSALITKVDIATQQDEFVANQGSKSNTILDKIYIAFAKNILKKENINEKAKNTVNSTVINTATTLSSFAILSQAKKITTILSSFNIGHNKALKAGAVIIPSLLAFAIHPILNKINNITLNKEDKKNHKTSIKECASNAAGAAIMGINPLLAPVSLALNSLTSYLNKNDNVSIKDFIDSHKETFGLDAIVFGAFVLSGLKGKMQLDNISNALEKAKHNIANPILYKMPKDSLTEFQSLARDLGFDLGIMVNSKGQLDLAKIFKLDEELLSILLEKGQDGNIEGKMKKLEEMNIFIPKYFQTVVDIPDKAQQNIEKQIDAILAGRIERQQTGRLNAGGNWSTNYALDEIFDKIDEKNWSLSGLKDYQKIIQNIKSNCPVSRTIDEAQEMIDSIFGKSKYIIDRSGKKEGLLGVGSIAESYLAKNENGEEVVIKLVKKHLQDGTKIAKDQENLLKKIDEKSDIVDGFRIRFGPDKYTITKKDRQDYDINQVKNMCKVWGQETDLTQEAKSASQIKSQATKYQAINAIEAKDGAFVMEKAKGIQLDDPNIAEKWKEAGLSEEDFSNFVDNYIGAYCEQLFSLPKAGEKVVQSDPHGGNILVDLANVKNINQRGATSPITIIDYGNTTKTNRLKAVENLFSHMDYLFGNTDAIASNILDGAQLNGKSKKAMIDELSKKLQEDIFNCDTKIDVTNPVEIFRTVNTYCTKFMQENNIIPNASNINQMKAEETYIMSNLGCIKRIADGCNYDLSTVIDKKRIIKQLVKEMSKSVCTSLKTNPIFTMKQVFSRIKFILKNPEIAFSCLGGNFELI